MAKYVQEDETVINTAYTSFKNSGLNNASAGTRSRRWLWVENNPTTAPAFEPAWIAFLIYSKEKGASGTIHWQGYMRLKNPCTLNKLKQWNKRAHFSIVRGTEEQNINYISKAPLEGPFKFGEPEAPGKRTDIQRAIEEINDGLKMKQVAKNNPDVFVRYHKGLLTYASLTAPVQHIPHDKFCVTYIWGPTGVGKTRFVYESVPAENLYTTIGDGTWWDGYDGHNVVLFDEFIGQVPLHMMLKYCDMYALSLPVKGAHVQKSYHTVYITSNLKPEMHYLTAAPEHRAAFLRRLTNVINLTPPVTIAVDMSPVRLCDLPPDPFTPATTTLLAQEPPLSQNDGGDTEPYTPLPTTPLGTQLNEEVSLALYQSAGLTVDDLIHSISNESKSKRTKKN